MEADDASEQSTLGLARHCVSIILVVILLLVLVGVAGGQVGGCFPSKRAAQSLIEALAKRETFVSSGGCNKIP